MIKNFIVSTLHLKVVNLNEGHDGRDINTHRDMGNSKWDSHFCRTILRRDYFGDLCLDARITLKRTLVNQGVTKEIVLN